MLYKGHDYHVGEVVRFRQWDDMKSEFGLLGRGIHIPNRPDFIEEMKHLCGTKAVIKKFCTDDYFWDVNGNVELDDFESCGETAWAYALEMLEPVEDPCSFDEGVFLSLLG